METKQHSNGSNLRSNPRATPQWVRDHRRTTRRHPERNAPPLAVRSIPRDTGRPQSLALPANHEFWLLLERFNKAALVRRFPGWAPEREADSRP